MKKDFKGKIIEVRKFSKKDTERAKDFMIYINLLVEEEAKLRLNKKQTLKDREGWVNEREKNIKKKKEVFLIAEYNKEIIGTASISLKGGNQSHVGEFFISIIDGYRRIGLGKFLMNEAIELAKIEFKENLKIIRLSVFSNNKPAIGLYEKMGFKIVASIPKQLKYKKRLVDEVVMLKFLK
jgi:ribosomal protein S18 acetylase RimI-like enzyme